MNLNGLKRENGIPIYRQLANHIKNQISSGVYRPGNVLPSEADYIRDFNVSRTTVRLAFGMITNAGLIKREQGRGTIVITPIRSSLPYLTSFTEEAIRVGREPSVVLLSPPSEEIYPEAANAIELQPDARMLKVSRLRLADKKPIGITISWLNIDRFPQLKTVDFSSVSLYKIFEDKLGLSIFCANESINADLANNFEEKLLKMDKKGPILRLKRTTYIKDKNDITVPIDYCEAVFNGNIYSVDVELYRQNEK